MCEQCSAATVTFGEVVPGWWLVRAMRNGNLMREGDFGLVACNDPDFVWPSDMPPQEDPSFGFTEEEFDNMTDEQGRAWDQFQDYVDFLTPYFRCDPETGYALVSAIYRAGYDREKHGCSMTAWLSHRMAAVMQRNPAADQTVSQLYASEDGKVWGHSREILQ